MIKSIVRKEIYINIANLLFVSTYFVFRLRSPFPVVQLNSFMIPLEMIYILLVFILFFKKHVTKEILFFILIFIIIISHYLVLQIFELQSLHITISLLKMLRLYSYFFITYIFAKYLLDFEKLIYYFLFYSIITLFFVCIIYFFQLNFLIDYVYGYLRPIVLLSEPSAFAPIVSFLLVYGFSRKNFFFILLALVSIICINSGMVLATSVSVMLLYIILEIKRKWFLIFTITIIIIIIILFLLLNNVFFSFQSFIRIIKMFESFDIASGSLGQSRLNTLYNIFVYLKETGALIFGTGFNTSIIYLTDESYSPFSFIHIILQSFGLVGIFIYFFIIIYSCFIIITRYNIVKIYIFYLSVAIPAMFNSAEGAVLYKFHLLIIFFIFFSNNSKVYVK